MIGSTRQVTAYGYGGPVDLRKGFDGLSALVVQELGRDPLSGDLFLFVNRARTLAKVLLWDGTGLCIYSKRLEQGRFACLWRSPEASRLRLTISELTLFLEGSELVGKIALSPPDLCGERGCLSVPDVMALRRDPDRAGDKPRDLAPGGAAARP